MHALAMCGLLYFTIASAACGKVRSVSDDTGAVDASPDSNIDGGRTAPDAGSQCPTGQICDSNLNFAFTSSTQIIPTELGGIQAGDALCNTLAANAGLPGNYIAWLSTESGDVRDRLSTASGWIRSDRRPFALNLAALLNSQIIYPMNLDENGHEVEGRAATATRPGGISDGDTCQDWTGSGEFLFGIPSSVGGKWTAELEVESVSCEEQDSYLYCLGVDFDAPLTMPAPVQGRLAWVSSSTLAGNVGITVMDAVCSAEATMLELGGAKAFVSTRTEAAADRFSVSGPTWVRSDGVILWETANDIRTKAPLAPILLHSDGSPVLDTNVWTGSVDLRTRSNSTGQDNCNDWQGLDNNGQGIVGISSRNGSDFFFSRKRSCTQDSLPIYCLEN